MAKGGIVKVLEVSRRRRGGSEREVVGIYNVICLLILSRDAFYELLYV